MDRNSTFRLEFARIGFGNKLQLDINSLIYLKTLSPNDVSYIISGKKGKCLPIKYLFWKNKLRQILKKNYPIRFFFFIQYFFENKTFPKKFQLFLESFYIDLTFRSIYGLAITMCLYNWVKLTISESTLQRYNCKNWK